MNNNTFRTMRLAYQRHTRTIPPQAMRLPIAPPRGLLLGLT
ncbi:hypothetical protein [Porphyromonas gingivicanis]|nr:hypothetical protein [Porphyromonas gingivicanis]